MTENKYKYILFQAFFQYIQIFLKIFNDILFYHYLEKNLIHHRHFIVVLQINCYLKMDEHQMSHGPITSLALL